VRVNRFKFLGAAATLFMMVSCATTAQSAVGFVDIQEVVRRSKVGKEAAKEIDLYVEEETSKIAKIESELRLLKKEVDSLAPESPTQKLSEEAEAEYLDKAWEYERRYKEYENAVNFFKQARELRNQQLLGRLLPKISKAIEVVAKSENYSAVYNKASNELYYKDNEKDLTEKVVSELNKE